MPGFDRTGPAGMGPMTGGGRGLCGTARTAYRRPLPDYRGFGWRSRAYWPSQQTDLSLTDLEGLKKQAESLKNDLKDLESRLEALSREK